MEMTIRMPASYCVMAEEEMIYTTGGATALDAVCAWLIFPFYGWFKGSVAIRDYRKQNPDTWMETGLDALNEHMETNATNLLYDIACTLSVLGVCATGIGLIPTALVIFL